MDATGKEKVGSYLILTVQSELALSSSFLVCGCCAMTSFATFYEITRINVLQF